MSRRHAPPPPDPDAGLWQGRSVARTFDSPDGWRILVGRTARDNDVLTFKLATPRDFWLHVAGMPGSHVVVLNPENESRMPRETERLAASLAAGYSSARKGGRVSVHVARRADVSKPRGLAPGKVTLGRFRTVQAAPVRDAPGDDADVVRADIVGWPPFAGSAPPFADPVSTMRTESTMLDPAGPFRKRLPLHERLPRQTA